MLTTSLAGCLGGADDPSVAPDPATGTDGDPSPLDNGTLPDLANYTAPPPLPADGLPFSANSCIGASIYLAVDLDEVQAALPPGFVAADGGILRGVQVPAETGDGLVAVDVLYCNTAQFAGGGPVGLASVSARIDPPAVGADLPPVDYEFYEFAKYASDANLTLQLGRVHYAIQNVTVEADKFVVPVGPSTSTAAATLDGEELFDVDATAVLAQRSYVNTRRAWHVTDEGLLHTDYAYEMWIHHGVAQCTFSEPVFGRTDCPLDGQWEGLVWDESLWTARIYFDANP